MPKNSQYWIGIGVSVASLAFFLFTVNVREMADALGEANYWYIAPAVMMYLISVYFRSLRWTAMLKHLKPISAWRLYPVVVIGYMVNNLMPLRLGEIVRAYYAGEREGISKAAALVTVFVERVFDAIALLFFIAVAALFVDVGSLAERLGESLGVEWLPWQALVAGFSLPFIGALAVLALFAAYPERTRSGALWLARPLPARARDMVGSLTATLLRGLEPLRSPKNMATLFVLSIPIWLTEAALFWIMGFSFGIDGFHSGPWDMAVTMIVVTSVANIGASIPAAPGGLGLFEIITRETLVLGPLAAVDRSIAGGFAIITHAVILLPMIALGQVFLWMNNVSLRSIRNLGLNRE